jgi:hypothetical protein
MADIKTAPQAYTRETLSQAFLWLRDQPNEIKERAKTPDALVSLYLHAVRHGLEAFRDDNGGDAPRSTQDFKKTLRDLSRGMKEFEDPTRPPEVFSEEPLLHERSLPPPVAPSPVAPPPKTNVGMALDARSLETLRRVQSRLNLSTEGEALRMLISLGYERLRTILPTS